MRMLQVVSLVLVAVWGVWWAVSLYQFSLLGYRYTWFGCAPHSAAITGSVVIIPRGLGWQEEIRMLTKTYSSFTRRWCCESSPGAVW